MIRDKISPERRGLSRGGRWAGLLLAVLLTAQGCAQRPVPKPYPPPGPPSVPQPVPPQTEAGKEPKGEQTPPSRRESVPVPQEGKAAGMLLASARQNTQSGHLAQAEMELERALRLEPRNARLWHEMAQVKFGQRDYGQTVQFCLKSNSLAGKDYDLIRRNWLLMEKAHQESGDPEKAQQARAKAG